MKNDGSASILYKTEHTALTSLAAADWDTFPSLSVINHQRKFLYRSPKSASKIPLSKTQSAPTLPSILSYRLSSNKSRYHRWLCVALIGGEIGSFYSIHFYKLNDRENWIGFFFNPFCRMVVCSVDVSAPRLSAKWAIYKTMWWFWDVIFNVTMAAQFGCS